METEYLIAIDEFCASHNIEISFISSLQQSGLIEITTIKESAFIEADQLQQLEKFVRLYYELDRHPPRRFSSALSSSSSAAAAL